MRSSSAEDVAVLLGYAQRVIVVPGYGLAVAQGQHTVAELQAALEARGIEVVFLKRSMRPGFAGIENELLYEPQTTLLFGDAKDSLAKVLTAVKAL